jgi:hypothetical protein
VSFHREFGMPPRNFVAAAAGVAALVSSALVSGALASSAALTPSADCVACYRHVVRPPVHGVVSERVTLNPVQAIARILPRYKTVAEKVLVARARNLWHVARGADGKIVGCWVQVPAQYTVRHRRVMVWPAQAETAAATRTRSVVLDRGGPAWEPIAVSPAHADKGIAPRR